MKAGDLVRLTGTDKLGIVMDVDKYDSYQGPDNKVITIAWLHTDRIGRAWSNALELVNGNR
tara:strand:- start:397 stop:579 length:183 start_codon:yes stop_codon:yes gene_type:complete